MTQDKKIKMAHVEEMSQAVAESNIEYAHAAREIMSAINPGSTGTDVSRATMMKSPIYIHEKTSWLLNPEVFKDVIGSVVICAHIDPMHPAPAFSPLGAPKKTIMCVKCSGPYTRFLAEQDPDKCDLCDTTPHKKFHEIMITAGTVNITGNICGNCNKTYMVR